MKQKIVLAILIITIVILTFLVFLSYKQAEQDRVNRESTTQVEAVRLELIKAQSLEIQLEKDRAECDKEWSYYDLLSYTQQSKVLPPTCRLDEAFMQ